MAQLFRPRSNTIARASIAGAGLLVAELTSALILLDLSSFSTRTEVPRDQPVPFSHKHHVGGLGVDCQYCHTSVETSAFESRRTPPRNVIARGMMKFDCLRLNQ